MFNAKMYKNFAAFYGDSENPTLKAIDEEAVDFMKATSDNHADSEVTLRHLASNPASGILLPYLSEEGTTTCITILHHVFTKPSRKNGEPESFIGFEGFDSHPKLRVVPDLIFDRIPLDEPMILTPSPNQLLGTTTENGILQLKVTAEQRKATEEDSYPVEMPSLQRAHYYKGRRAISIPPFIMAPLITVNDPASAYIVVQEELTKFFLHDMEVSDDPVQAATEKMIAKFEMIPILQLLWIMATEKANLPANEQLIPLKLSQLPHPTDPATIAQSKAIAFPYSANLNGYEQDEDDSEASNSGGNGNDNELRREMRKATTAMKRTGDAIFELVGTMKEQMASQATALTTVAPATRAGTKWTERLMPFQQNMLLNASADTRIPTTAVRATAPNELFRRFLEGPSKQSLQTLANDLNVIFNLPILVDWNLVTTLHSMQLMTSQGAEHACRFSIFFMAASSLAENAAAAMNDIEFNLRSENHLLSEEHIKTASKSKMSIPNTISDLKDHLRHYKGLLQYVFSEVSEPYKAISDLLREMENDTNTYVQALTTDHLFIVKLMVAVDDKMRFFLDTCTRVKDYKEIDLKLLDFTADIYNIKLRTFNRHIPKYLQAAMEAKKGTPKSDGTTNANLGSSTTGEKGNKKRNNSNDKTPNESPNKKSKATNKQNQHQVAAWTIQAKQFQHFAADKESIPQYKGEHVCLKWHLNGFCGSGSTCERVSTHVQLTGADFNTMDKWFKSNKAATAPTLATGQQG